MVREYEGEGIVVTWQPERCIHTANCIRGLPAVFNPPARPWVRLEGTDAEAAARVIRTCPTGALTYRRTDGAPQEAPDAPSVVPVPNGPLFVRGDLTITADDGAELARGTRFALCRCGGSRNKPFCDNTHRLVRFRTL